MWVDSMAPYGVVGDARAIVSVQDPAPNATVTLVTGETRVESIVTVGFWVRLAGGDYRYVE